MNRAETGDNVGAPAVREVDVRKRGRAGTLRRALPIAVAAATLLTFSPALRNEFVAWDDDINIVENAAFRGLGAGNLHWMFTTFLGGHYQPLTWLSYAVDSRLWGVQPFGYHLTNIVLHALGAALFFFVALRLLGWAFVPRGTGAGSADVRSAPDRPSEEALLWGAALAAAIFALHPLRVESVAWATERRDVLSGVFVFVTLLAYLRAVARPRVSLGWLVLAWAAFCASLLSKAAAMTLPAVLLLVDVYPAARLRNRVTTIGRLLAEKVPFVAVSIIAAGVAVAAQRSAGSWRPLSEMGVLARAATVCHGLWFYLYRLIRPMNLSPLYPVPPREQLLGPTLVASSAALVIVVVLALAFRRRFPAVVAALVSYVAILAPVSGIAQSGKQLVADRYSYLSLLPFAVLAAGGLLLAYTGGGSGSKRHRSAKVFGGLAGAYVFGVALLSVQQTIVWHDSVTLWRHALRIDPANQVACVNLGEALRVRGLYEEAAEYFQKSLALDARDDKAHNGLGVTLLELNRPKAALARIKEAVDLRPDRAEYRCNLGYALAGFGRLEEAAAQYRAALRIAPSLGAASERLGAILADLGRFGEARAVLTDGLRQAPSNRSMRGSLAWLLATCPADEERDGALAVALARSIAVETNFRDPWALHTLAASYAETGSYGQALATAGLALARATELGEAALAEDVQRCLELYRAGRPFRERAKAPPAVAGE